MTRFVLLLSSLLLYPALASAQTAPTTAPMAASSAADDPALAIPAPVLQPFIATYAVFANDHRLGDAVLQLQSLGDSRWRIDLTMHGSGLVRLTGLNVQQSIVFDSDGQHYRPLSQSTHRRVFLSTRKSTGVYDWANHVARWTGDLKPSRRAPVALQDGDMSGLLIDLAVIRDAAPGKTLHYRYVDGGRAREHTYMVAAEPESVEVDGLGYSAMRVARMEADGDQTTVWVAHGVPTPIRLLQREDGDDSTDLRLIEYQ